MVRRIHGAKGELPQRAPPVRVGLGRAAEPEEIARMALFLAERRRVVCNSARRSLSTADGRSSDQARQPRQGIAAKA